MASTVFLWWEIVRQTERQRQRERETERKWERERRKETEIVHVHFWAMCAHVQVFALHVYRSMCTHVYVYRIDLCLHFPSLNAFCSHCFVLYCFIVQHAKLWCIPGVRALSVFHYNYTQFFFTVLIHDNSGEGSVSGFILQTLLQSSVTAQIIITDWRHQHNPCISFDGTHGCLAYTRFFPCATSRTVCEK